MEFIDNEQFQKLGKLKNNNSFFFFILFIYLGITATKQIIRLLNQYVSHSNLVKDLIKPLWYSHPHQDIRACLILTIPHFIGKSNSNNKQKIIWKTLEEAAEDRSKHIHKKTKYTLIVINDEQVNKPT